MFPKCNLPWLLLILYLVFELGIINIGITETDYTAQLFAGDTSPALLTKLIVVLVANMLASDLLIFIRNLTSNRISHNMRIVLLKKVFRLPMSFFQKEDPREVVYRLVDRAIVVESTIMLAIIPFLMAGYKSIAIFGKVFTYDWRLSAILLGVVPFKILIAFIFGRLNFSLSRSDERLNTKLTQRLAEMIMNIPLAKAFAKEDREAKRARS